MTYSVAIRTLGTAGDKFRQELESIKNQTIQPDKVIVYIAEGYPRPDFQIGKEKYIWVKKGMMIQRLLPYDEFDNNLILFLDDDVELATDSVERMIMTLEENHLDAIGADVFQNFKMSFGLKLYSTLVNLVTPHFSNKWAFRIKGNGSFSYNNNPHKDLYPSQSCAGPAWMIKKSVYSKLRYQDELWLESFGFPYCEDQLETYKIYKNGFKLGVLYNSGIHNLDAGTESVNYHKDKNKIYIRTKSIFAIWWRTIFLTSNSTSEKILSAICFFSKILYSIFPIFIFSLRSFSVYPISQFFKGNIDAWKLVHSSEFKSLPPYVIEKV